MQVNAIQSNKLVKVLLQQSHQRKVLKRYCKKSVLKTHTKKIVYQHKPVVGKRHFLVCK